jgi:hypothetical protein
MRAPLTFGVRLFAQNRGLAFKIATIEWSDHMDPETLKVTLLAFSAAAAIGSAISAILNWRVASSNKEFNRHATNRTAASKHEELIANHPQLLDLHGFSHQNLAKLGLTQIEVAYLLSSFTAGDLFYQDGKVKELTQYRKVLLQSGKVQVTWKEILKGKFIGPGQFTDLLDAHLKTNPPTRA